MLIQTRTIVVEKGHSNKVVDRFTGESPMDSMAGLIDKTVMINRKKQEHEEVMVMIRWRSVEDWKNWEKSDVHIQGHRQNRGKTPPEYVISTTVNMYEVEAVKEGIN
ncbi:antibiotic biosynthesis monooxygenase [Halalkalibacter akibai]|uniref:Antibiotic biosynthesis monooxygenase n=1 Tax=Halalkalibacter akibai (strain ATCC 43226 / DSM 21942 / CIP 109018 / JCM 9157 / 1139) TaxID=1236973 RepID=W4QUC0_HALA3|nr:antibiotic biosynthesis monooxygenase [Halalkalibacter akibai]GAE35492.1 antibiotic biosynthesis monooxygenase [Halalkalibacter akibai JCM 9157]